MFYEIPLNKELNLFFRRNNFGALVHFFGENKILAPLGWGYTWFLFFSPPSEQFWEFERGGPEESHSDFFGCLLLWHGEKKSFFPEYKKTRASRLWLTPLHFYPGVIFHGKSSTFSV